MYVEYNRVYPGHKQDLAAFGNLQIDRRSRVINRQGNLSGPKTGFRFAGSSVTRGETRHVGGDVNTYPQSCIVYTCSFWRIGYSFLTMTELTIIKKQPVNPIEDSHSFMFWCSRFWLVQNPKTYNPAAPINSKIGDSLYVCVWLKTKLLTQLIGPRTMLGTLLSLMLHGCTGLFIFLRTGIACGSSAWRETAPSVFTRPCLRLPRLIRVQRHTPTGLGQVLFLTAIVVHAQP